MTQWKAHAEPTKEFFINMITRDIGLDECIFDLLDNSIDGASRVAQVNGAHRLDGFCANITINSDRFIIEDNCGGMTIEDATEYAFHFGRKEKPKKEFESENAIGLYGIGMKRAIFKIGNLITIQSSTKEAPEEAFQTLINVEEWALSGEWEFDLEQINKPDFVGTKITVDNLNEGAASEFADQIFLNRLQRDLGRYYSFFLQDGFVITINGLPITQHIFGVREDDNISPFYAEYVDQVSGVNVKIISGLAGFPPDDAGDPLVTRNTENWGWFVVCNNRVVLAGDKTSKTIWSDNFPAWHSQYNGFMGLIFFHSENPKSLPWTTTKRQIDETLPVFRRATSLMKDATRYYLDYTNSRKANLEVAKQIEERAPIKAISEFKQATSMKLPLFEAKPRVQMATIAYQQPVSVLRKVAEALGNSQMSYKQVGVKTFEYYLNNEVD